MTKETDKKLNEREQVEALMTWIDRKQLTEADQSLVADELARSPDLQDELALEKALIGALAKVEEDEQAAADASHDAAWQSFKSRLEAQERGDGQTELRPTPARAAGAGRSSSWRKLRMPQSSLGWLATAQAAALVAMAVFLIPSPSPDQPGEFQTLSSGEEPQVPSGNAVLVFQPSASAASLNNVLDGAGARIVDGPMANGAYVISIDPDGLEDAIESLRESEDVVMVEALSDESQP